MLSSTWRRCAFRGVRTYHFASPGYHAAFLPAVSVDHSAIRAAAVDALAKKHAGEWHDSPVVSLLKGKKLDGGARTDTVDAFGAVNGAQLLASHAEVEQLRDHAATFRPAPADLRAAVRRAEARMLTVHAGELVANQTLDFGKQDGVTEIEEALQANEVERRLNDQLWEAEAAGSITVPRRVALVPCVSNFSHFLDMCRKSLRLIEIGVPVMVLSRTHTQQYCYRWVSLLSSELAAEGVDPRYLSFASASLEEQQRVMRAADVVDAATLADAAPDDDRRGETPPTPCLFTGARTLAQHIKANVCPGLVASTQGPNLMIALGLPPSVAEAAALSTAIENSGQCTAMRVLVAPKDEVTDATLVRMFDGTPASGNASTYLAAGTFAGMLNPSPAVSPLTTPGAPPSAFTAPDGYASHPSLPIAFKTRTTLPDMPGAGEPPFPEFWRQVRHGV